MTTINSLDDFLQALDANPSWRETVRSRILGEELLQLPVRFSAFATHQEAWNPRQEEWNAKQETWNENATIRFNRIEADMSSLKGDYARTRTVQDGRDIAADLGLQYIRTLTVDDLHRMAGSDLERDVLRSFRNADLVIEATDGTDTSFIAMEISFTADQRDCSRGNQKRRAHHPVHRETSPSSGRQRQERPGSRNSGGIRHRVLAPAGGPDSGPGVKKDLETIKDLPPVTPEKAT